MDGGAGRAAPAGARPARRPPPFVLPVGADPVAWASLLQSQFRAVTAAQARGFGIGRRLVTGQVEAGRWRHWLPQVYLVGVPALPRRATLLSAALLHGGDGAVLSHRTAAEEWGLLPREPGPVHVTVPYGRSVASHEDRVVVHRTQDVPALTAPTTPPRTTRADTILDLAADEPDEPTARATLLALMRSSGVPATDLTLRLSTRRTRRHTRTLRAALATE